jgi:serine/threonine protein kinase
MPCCAQVADFGTVRIGVSAGDNSHVSTKVIAGTKGESNAPLFSRSAAAHCSPIAPTVVAPLSPQGYMPPEYTMSGHVSERTDAFAFGMVLLELLAGRPPRETAELYTMEPGKRGRWRCMCMFTQ